MPANPRKDIAAMRVEVSQLQQRSQLRRIQEVSRVRSRVKPNIIPDRDIAANLREFNVGVAGTLGLPVDAVGAMARLSGLTGTLQFLGAPEGLIPGVKGDQVGGAQSIQRAFAEIGASPAPGLEGDDIMAKLMRNLGATTVPVIGVASRARTATRAVALAATETVAAGTATIGGEVGREISGGNVVVQALFELVGGIVPAGVLAGAGRGGRGAFAVGKQVVVGGQGRAAGRAQELAIDPKQAAADVGGADVLEGLPPADRTAEAGLVELQATIEARSPKVARRLDVARSDVMKEGRRLLAFGGVAEEFINHLKNLAVVTAERARRRLAKIGEGKSERQQRASQEVKGMIDDALDFQEKIEVKAWDAVDVSLRIRLGHTLRNYGLMLAKRTEINDAKEIPKFIRDALGSIGEDGKFIQGTLAFETDLGRVKTLRGRILKELRDERKRPDVSGNKLRILSEIADSLTADAMLVNGGEKLEAAARVSRGIHKTYREGAVGKLFGYEATGGPTVNPALSLNEVLTVQGNRQNVAMKQLLDAAPETFEGVEEFLRTSFVIAATDPVTVKGITTNVLNVPRAKKFLKANAGALEELPELKKQLEKIMKSQGRVDELLGVTIPHELTPLIRHKAAAGLILGGPVDQAMKRLLATGDPAMMRSARNTVLKDPEALKGLKAAFGEEILASGRQGTSVDLLGEPVFSGGRMRKFQKRTAKMAKELFTKEERVRINTIINTFEKLDRSRRVGRIAGPLLTDKISKILFIATRILAARTGGTIAKESAGGSLQTAQILSKEAGEQLTRMDEKSATAILTLSIEDGELFKKLLLDLNIASPKEVTRALDFIRPFLAVPAGTALEGGREGNEGTIRDLFGIEF